MEGAQVRHGRAEPRAAWALTHPGTAWVRFPSKVGLPISMTGGKRMRRSITASCCLAGMLMLTACAGEPENSGVKDERVSVEGRPDVGSSSPP